jgi:hypothetical protein
MPAPYGVVSTGFNRKNLMEILGEIEAAMVTEFGPNVIQTPQSPFGQINGLMSDLISSLWEFGEDIYQSYDIDQAESIRLDMLATLRLMQRGMNESDESFRLAITNQGRARIDTADITRAIAGLDGVTYVQVFVNDTGLTDENLLPPASICVAVLGGDDEEIAYVLRQYVVPGITTYGNTSVSTDIDGYCRAMMILRPILVPVELYIEVKTSRDNNGCPPPSPVAIRDALIADLAYGGSRQLINGDDLDFYRIRSAIESRWTNVQVVQFKGKRDNIEQVFNQPVDIAFIELATLIADKVTVNAI